MKENIEKLSDLEESPLSPMSYGLCSTDRKREAEAISPESTPYYVEKSRRLKDQIDDLQIREILGFAW